MFYTALIQADTGQVLNALATPNPGVGLVAGDGQTIVAIDEAAFLAGPIGRRWDGVTVTDDEDKERNGA